MLTDFKTTATPAYRGHSRALITGATGSIGAAFARALPRETALLLTGRDLDKLHRIQVELGYRGRDVEIVPADLTTDEGREAVIVAANRAGIDLLVNNAGMGRVGAFLDHMPDEIRMMTELNVVTPAVLTRRLLPHLLENASRSRGRAGLIMVSSTTAFAPVPFFTTYAATKAFDLVFAEGLVEEMRGQPIDILAVCPGMVRPGRRKNMLQRAVPSPLRPERVARESLAALGHKTVHIVGPASSAVLNPLAFSRAVMASGVGQAMKMTGRFFR